MVCQLFQLHIQGTIKCYLKTQIQLHVFKFYFRGMQLGWWHVRKTERADDVLLWAYFLCIDIAQGLRALLWLDVTYVPCLNK